MLKFRCKVFFNSELHRFWWAFFEG